MIKQTITLTLTLVLFAQPASAHIGHWLSHLHEDNHAHVHHEANKHKHGHEHEDKNDDHHTIPLSEQIPATLKRIARVAPAIDQNNLAIQIFVIPLKVKLDTKTLKLNAHAPPIIYSLSHALPVNAIHGPPYA